MSDARRAGRSDDRRVLVYGLFVVYLLMLAWLVLWKSEIPWIGGGALRRIKWIPFVAGAGVGGSAPREVVANIGLFLPFGIYLSLLFPMWGWWKAVGVIAGASAVLEVLQYALAVGISDVTDVCTNTAGGVAGIGLAVLLRRKLQARTATVVSRTALITTALALVLIGIFHGSGLRYGPQH